MGQVVMFAGSKVGTGKTTATVMTALAAEQLFKQRVLIIDATSTLQATKICGERFGVAPKANLLTGLAVKNLATVVTQLTPQLDLIAGTAELEAYFDRAMEAEATTKTTRASKLMPALLAALRAQYDYILLDTDAQFATVMDNCLASTDYVVVMQPVGNAGFQATDKLFYYLKQLKDEQPNIKATIIGHLMIDLTNKQPFYQVEPVSSVDVVDAFKTVITYNDWLAGSAPFALSTAPQSAAQQLASVMYSEIFNELQARIALQQQLGKFATSAGLTKQGQAVDLFS
ncbi:ParA family protein [Loigolactobacillus binensis]|uniref:AAA family ATPase n=1 Tax=Loigolactobacillus binensis TaxID=2559922 RepID=A0ABW3EEC5_9LACO|nr:ParA family protein [Loigolactobacillus binensis]